MGKAGKKRRSDLRRDVKRQRKAIMQAQYEEWAKKGVNRKSKRALNMTRRQVKPQRGDHPEGHCGNIGCARCFPEIKRRQFDSHDRLIPEDEQAAA